MAPNKQPSQQQQDSFLRAFKQYSKQGSHLYQEDQRVSNGSKPFNHEHLGKLDLAYRLSTLAIESQNRSMTAHDDLQAELEM